MHKTKKLGPFTRQEPNGKTEFMKNLKIEPADFPHWICVLK